MAAMAKNNLSLVFLLLLSLLSLQTHARQSQFFSKTVRSEAAQENDHPVAQPTDTFVPTKLNPETTTGYGLYGRKYDQLPSVSTFNEEYSKAEFSNPGAEFSETYQPSKEYRNAEPNYKYNSREYENRDFTSRDPTTEFENAEEFASKEVEEEEPTKNYPTKEFEKGEPTQNLPTAEFENLDPARRVPTAAYETFESRNRFPAGVREYESNKPFGMSDTRFLENGRYFYDLNSEKEELDGYGDAGKKFDNRGFYENNKNSFEYNSKYPGSGYTP